jgi:probable HAF family extracellular repeat protein
LFPQLPAGYATAAFLDSNDAGQIAGYRTVNGTTKEAILYERGVWTALGYAPGGDSSEGLAINNAGTVVGYWKSPAGELKACRWDGGIITDLGPAIGRSSSMALCISESGVIGGFTIEGFNSETGFTLNRGSLTVVRPFPGSSTAEVVGLNNAGTTLVMGRPPEGPPGQEAFVATGDQWEQIPALEAPLIYVLPHRINQYGVVIGDAFDPICCYAPIIFSGGESHALEDQLVNPPAGLHLDTSNGLNDSGWIVARGHFEPSSPVMVVLKPASSTLGDFNGDCQVTAEDLGLLLGLWGGSDEGDLDSDGIVGASDLAILLGNWSVR